MLKPEYSTKFKKDLKVIGKRNYDTNELKNVIRMLCEQRELPLKHKDHALIGDLSHYRECHIKSDWLLVYQIGNGILFLARTGTHSDLF